MRISFMAKLAADLICLPLVSEHLDELEIEPMVTFDTSRFGTAFNVSVEAKDVVTTVINAQVS